MLGGALARDVVVDLPNVPDARPPRGRLRSVLRWIPPVRLLWIFLALVGTYGVNFFGNGTGIPSLLLLPLVGAVVDLVFQAVRYPSIRVPDAAIATGLFLALIFPPTAPLLLAAAAVGGAVVLRHILRFRGRPWFNPAVTGAVLGFLLFGLAPAWWVAVGPVLGVGSVGEFVMVGLGLLLLARNWRSWRLPAIFFLRYGFLAIVQHLVVGASTDPRVLLLQAIDPVTIFFGLYIVTEPRTAPAEPRLQTLYAGTVGLSVALFPIFLPSLGVFVGVLVGNLLAVALRRTAPTPEKSPLGRTAPRPRAVDRKVARATPAARSGATSRWPIAYRVSSGILSLIVIASVAGIAGVGHSSTPLFQVTGPGGGGGGGGGIGCAKDNPAIPVSTLSTLHRMLGPSVILSYDRSTGVVVFYDPVNQVTVTETDLYEDYGYAEFNGDDYAVSGCSG